MLMCCFILYLLIFVLVEDPFCDTWKIVGARILFILYAVQEDAFSTIKDMDFE